ncbi:MAG: succinate dehydrogenase cytochrome b subunit [Spirosomataceae bacterium]
MSWLAKTLSSSIGKKVLMSLTGLFLCSFLIIHLVGNLQLFKSDGGYAFNVYAVFMTTFPVIKVISYLLYASIVFHAIWGIYLEIKNRQARPTRYAVVKNSSTWASRNMAILGTILFVYIAVHMNDFWWKYKQGNLPFKMYAEDMRTGKQMDGYPKDMPKEFVLNKKMEETVDFQQGVKITIVKDLYTVVQEGFKNIFLVIFYVLAMVAVAYHLIHGFQSAFQTLGINHKKYTPLIKFLGVWGFGVLIPLGFAAMPIFFYLKSLNVF